MMEFCALWLSKSSLSLSYFLSLSLWGGGVTGYTYVHVCMLVYVYVCKREIFLI